MRWLGDRARVAPMGVAVVALAWLAGCAAPAQEIAGAPPTRAPAPAAAGALFEWGRASYYSDRLAGRATAAGERYDPAAFTAAHRTLPFGTLVDVVRADGRRVTVRINDRGPHVDGRVIDLSRRAASELGMLRDGVIEVALQIVWMPPPRARSRRRLAER